MNVLGVEVAENQGPWGHPAFLRNPVFQESGCVGDVGYKKEGGEVRG